tara:strand:+ start:5670 stop:6866 length:1197 start_codon:yes stop_codon:yes gene_type:complete
MPKRALTDLDVKGKRVLVRVDFNVPIEQGIDAIALYDQRLRSTLPTIKYLRDQSSIVILCSHLGRPKGEVDETLRLAPIGDRLSQLLGCPVTSLSDCIGEKVSTHINELVPGDVVLLENLRFHPGEEKNEDGFIKSLASLADVFIMDAFAVAHRSHASVVGVTKHLPSAMGLLVKREVDSMSKALENPDTPMAALMGGAKVSDKILVIENLLDRLDHLVIGGGMAVTFLSACRKPTGASRVESDRIAFAKWVMEESGKRDTEVHLPQDLIVASEFSATPSRVATVDQGEVPDNWFIMDIGPKSAQSFAKILGQCKTIIWNGPMGVFEMDSYKQGTVTIGNTIANMQGVTTVVGGGSTAEAVESMGITDKLTHVSTGGGASLEFLEGKVLPGIDALPDK